MRYKYVSINRIFSKLIRDVTDDFDEGDVIEWCGEALEFAGAAKSYDEAVAFIEVKDHQCVLPPGLHSVIQVARNHNVVNITDSACPTPALVAAEVPNIVFNKCKNGEEDMGYVVLDGCGTPVVEYDIAYYRPYFDLKSEFLGWSNSNYYHRNYTPVRLATSSFFNSVVCKEKDSSLYHKCIDEYTIIQGSILRFSFRKGFVAVAYLRPVLDEETGYPKIPDHISYTTAIVKYITMKMCEREFYAGREGAKMRLDKSEADWHWYCKQAGNVDMMPYGVDEHQNLLDQRSYLIPQRNEYFGFFGNLATPEGYRDRVSSSTGDGKTSISGEDQIIINNVIGGDNPNLIQDDWQ